MLSIWEILQLIVAVTMLLLALFCSNVRGAAWIVAIALDLLLSAQWWIAGLPHGDVVGATCDFSVCALIYFFGRYKWELWVFRLLQVSVLVNIIDFVSNTWLSGWLDHDTYSIALEIVNYAAFFLIGGISRFVVDGNLDRPAFAAWGRVLSFDTLVHRTRAKD